MVEEARSEQTAPGAQNVQQHGDRSPGKTPPAQTSTHVETKWCTHCAKYLGTKEKLAHHIKTKHNDVVVKKDDGKMHTKVVHFQLDDVADASNCSNTPAFNVLCPEDSDPCDTNPIPPGESHEGVLTLASRPQDGIPTPLGEINVGASTSTSCPQDTNPIPPGEVKVGASTSTGNPVQGLVKRSGHNCEHLEERQTKKEEEGGAEQCVRLRPDTVPPKEKEKHPPVQTVQPTEEIDPQLATREETEDTELTAGVALIGKTLRYTFPMPKLLSCPMAGCTAPFSTARWYWSTQSIKRHLRLKHEVKDPTVQYWCAPCGNRIRVFPMKHPCVVRYMRNEREAEEEGAWPCADCDESFPNRMGLLNHQRMHRRNVQQEKLPALKNQRARGVGERE
ncbi:hypothetical protein TNCV_4585681 [Trichonephila clavipes]|nr:hypothetical protein TNCV_4585681 [Trichonephila clavipes]